MRASFLFFWALSCHFLVYGQTIPLYRLGEIPFAKPGGEVPTLTVFQPEKAPRRGIAVIVCSGGSYGGRANTVEGIPAAEKLKAAGITAFLLDYRVPNDAKMSGKKWVPLTDAQRAIQYVREHAARYHIDKNKVGIMGFSAGGHLASTVATHFDTTRLDDPKGINLRPDFAVLVYPVISFADSLTHRGSRNNLIAPDLSVENIRYYSNELQVNYHTPPCFIVHAVDDRVVKVENSLYFSAMLRQYGIKNELYIYVKGGHGFGVNNRFYSAQWIDHCIDWMKGLR